MVGKFSNPILSYAIYQLGGPTYCSLASLHLAKQFDLSIPSLSKTEMDQTIRFLSHNQAFLEAAGLDESEFVGGFRGRTEKEAQTEEEV